MGDRGEIRAAGNLEDEGLVMALLGEIAFEPLAKLGGLDTDQGVMGGVELRPAVKDGYADLMFLDLFGCILPGAAAEEMEQLLEACGAVEMRGSADAFSQSPHFLFWNQGRRGLVEMHLNRDFSTQGSPA